MSLVNSGSLAFTILAADVNTLDTTPVTIETFRTNTGLIRIPTRLELVKAAGTAYTIENPKEELRYGAKVLLPPPFGSYSDNFDGGSFLVIRDNNGIVFFRVPLQGFLDSASEQIRVSFAALPSGTFKPGSTSTDREAFTLEAQLTVKTSGGTGSLKGRIYFDEYGGF